MYSVHLSLCLCVCLSVCLPVSLPACLSCVCVCARACVCVCGVLICMFTNRHLLHLEEERRRIAQNAVARANAAQDITSPTY